MKTYDRLQKLSSRREDPLIKASRINENYSKIQAEPAIKYVIGAMQPIDPDYTRNTYAESERIQESLKGPLEGENFSVSFGHQGSVTNDTHIKAHSDIDLLTVNEAFTTIELPNKPSFPYSGNPNAELCQLRESSTRIIRSAYPKVILDTSGRKCISLSGGSLKRKIDVVFCNWWDTVDYVSTNIQYHRGIKVLDYATKDRVENKPFLHNKKIDEKDSASSGNVRKGIRLIKSLIYDSESDDCLSSYDVAAIVYHASSNISQYSKGQELQLSKFLLDHLKSFEDSYFQRATCRVPNGTRLIFADDGANTNQLKSTIALLDTLLNEVSQGLVKSLTRLEEARYGY